MMIIMLIRGFVINNASKINKNVPDIHRLKIKLWLLVNSFSGVNVEANVCRHLYYV